MSKGRKCACRDGSGRVKQRESRSSEFCNMTPDISPKFPKPLILEKIGDMLWEVYEEFDYYVGNPMNNDLIVIPKGFHTDLASVPRLFWTFFPPDGKYTYGALPHDYIYWTQTRTREATDKIFL